MLDNSQSIPGNPNSLFLTAALTRVYSAGRLQAWDYWQHRHVWLTAGFHSFNLHELRLQTATLNGGVSGWYPFLTRSSNASIHHDWAEYLLVIATANGLGCRHLFATLLLLAFVVTPLTVGVRYFVWHVGIALILCKTHARQVIGRFHLCLDLQLWPFFVCSIWVLETLSSKEALTSLAAKPL